MRIVRKRSTHGTLEPGVKTFLHSVPENKLYYEEHSLRHPLGIFNISASRVYSAFSSVLISISDICKQEINRDINVKIKNGHIKELQMRLNTIECDIERQLIEKDITECRNALKIGSKQHEQFFTQYLNDYTEVLDSLMAFIDDTYLIIKCFYPAVVTKKNTLFAYQWLEKVDPKTIQSYYVRIKEYRDFLSAIVNRIKHNHARLRFISFWTQFGLIPGYYIEGVIKSGGIGPDPAIHKDFSGVRTAFSFYRDIKYHWVNFYLCAHHLKVILERYSILSDSSQKEPYISRSEDEAKIENLNRSIAQLPYLFFADERVKPVPVVAFNEDETVVTIEFPTNLRLPNYGDEVRISTTFQGDGVTRTFSLPYFNG